MLAHLLTVIVAMQPTAVTPADVLPDYIYVDANADQAPHDGSDWCHAFTELHEALGVATTGAIIRVADGVYRPDTAGLADPRTAAFDLVHGASLKGGFAGCGAADPNANDPALFETVLSGDIGAANVVADNCYHVVIANGISGSTVVEGVTITDGNADGAGSNRQGGGMLLLSAAPTVRSCTFRDNRAVFGGGMFNSGGFPAFVSTVFEQNTSLGSGAAAYNFDAMWDPAPSFNGCRFEDNTAEGDAGAIRNYDAYVDVADCTFRGNLAKYSGGAVDNGGHTIATFFRCLFELNRADTLFAPHDAHGGAVYNTESSEVRMVSCAFDLNAASSSPPGIAYGGALSQSDDASLTLQNCTLVGHNANVGNGLFISGNAVATISSSILSNGWSEIVVTGSPSVGVTYSAVTGSWPGTGNTADDPLLADLRLQPGSPCINTGDPAYVPATGEADLDGHARVLCGRVDMGAYEFGAGDFDCNQLINLSDFASWDDCMTGPHFGPYPSGCEAFDYEYDDDVDFADFATFQSAP